MFVIPNNTIPILLISKWHLFQSFGLLNFFMMGVLDGQNEEDKLLTGAIKANNQDRVVEILQRIGSEQPTRYFRDKSQECLLFSVQTGNVMMTCVLLNKLCVSATCETKDGNKSQPVHLAVLAKSPELVKEIVKHGASVNVKNGLDKYPLDLAIESKDLEMVKVLVSLGAFVNRVLHWRYFEETEQPIQTAIRLKNWDIFYFFLKNGADLKCVDSKGSTCIDYALKYDEYSMLERLINNGADVNIGCPLLTALRMQSFEMVSLLLKHKASVKTRNKDAVVCHVPLAYQKDLNKHSDLHRNIYTEIIRLSHAYLNETDITSGFAPLHYAAELDCQEIVQLLLEHGADIDVKTRKGKYTPLWLSVSPGSSPRMASFLIENCANVHVYNEKGGLLNQLVLSASHGMQYSIYVMVESSIW